MISKIPEASAKASAIAEDITKLYQVDLDLYQVEGTNLQQCITLELCKAYNAGKDSRKPYVAELKTSRAAWRAIAKSRLFTLGAIFDELKATIEELKRPKSDVPRNEIPIPVSNLVEIRELYKGGFRPLDDLDRSLSVRESEFMNTCILCNWTEENETIRPIGHSPNCDDR